MSSGKSGKEELVAIIDFGAQYGQLIARRVREAQVYCEVFPHNVHQDELKKRNPKGIIFTGGPASVYAPSAPRIDRGILDLGVPVLGICYGMQLISRLLGGDVRRGDHREYGAAELEIEGGSAAEGLFGGLDGRLRVWMSHGDLLEAPPPGFEVLARTRSTPVAAMGDPERRIYGVQFHPEVVHTPDGKRILENFLYRVCRCSGSWTMSSFIEEAVARIREQVGEGHAVCALSGGVDSAVAAALVDRAIGGRLTCIFVDHGLLRLGEAEKVARTFRGLGLNLVAVDASRRFLSRLEGVEDPERKRKIIGEEFIRVFEEEADRLGRIEFLVQGTLYPDVIESGTATAAMIKSHHNVGGLPDDMALALVEPLHDLFKDEVRRVGAELGLPDEVIQRQPFPGPGLAVRIIGEVTPEGLDVLRRTDAIVLEEIKAAGLYRRIWQSFAVLASGRSVGVMGDERTYGYTIAVRAVESRDGMTADWSRLPHDVLARISSRIVNEIAEVNRVVYDVTSKPPATIEWE